MEDIIRELREELHYQKKLLKKLEEELVTLPPGSLCIKVIKGKEYVYVQQWEIDGNGNKKLSQRCLPKKEIRMAEKILRRRFAEKNIAKLRISTKGLEKFLEKYEPYSVTDIYKALPKAYLKFDIRGYLPNNEMEIADWSESLTEKTDMKFGNKNRTLYPKDLKHVTSKGLFVRSKSEAIICELLDHHKVLYKYENPIFAGEKKYYPDFTVMRKFDRKIIYWEHFGMIGNRDYSQNMIKKLKNYESIGIIPWDNLIITTDSMDGRINIRHIRTIISNMLTAQE